MNGHIRKRGKNSWQLIFDLPRDADGKRKQARRTVHGTKREADSKLRELVSGAEKGDYVTPSKESVGEFLTRWLDLYAANSTSPRTLEDYQGIIRRYLNRYLGAVPLSALKPDNVQGLYAEMRNRGLSSLTILHTHRLLSECLSHAVKWQILTKNVCDAVDPPRPQRRQMTSLDEDEVGLLLDASDSHPYRDVFFVALYTGLRRSELLALRWSEVDLDRPTLSVVAGLHRLPRQGLILLPTKTSRSRRQISLTDEVVGVLHQIRGQQMVQKIAPGSAWEDTGFVFTKPNGTPLDPERVSKEFSKVVKTAKIPKIRFHDLRHTHASLMLKAGVGPKAISELLGHASISITMDVYAHLIPGILEEAAQKFSNLLAAPRKGKS